MKGRTAMDEKRFVRIYKQETDVYKRQPQTKKKARLFQVKEKSLSNKALQTLLS